jgi:hypothetical protein
MFSLSAVSRHLPVIQLVHHVLLKTDVQRRHSWSKSMYLRGIRIDGLTKKFSMIAVVGCHLHSMDLEL